MSEIVPNELIQIINLYKSQIKTYGWTVRVSDGHDMDDYHFATLKAVTEFINYNNNIFNKYEGWCAYLHRSYEKGGVFYVDKTILNYFSEGEWKRTMDYCMWWRPAIEIQKLLKKLMNKK